ncbi:FAD-binding protein, partial [Clostridium perfringens]|uniref:FAD-binding protein n=1 Tax=Clostridium perfringens TaxID=1502 RepID=UPI002AC71D47
SIKSGKDELFFSNTSRLISVDKAPYYAIKFSARNLGTLGGIRINENIEVVNAKGMPIDGLYAAGADAGGMYGKAYVDFEGATLGFAYTSGRLAGINAANYVKSN